MSKRSNLKKKQQNASFKSVGQFDELVDLLKSGKLAGALLRFEESASSTYRQGSFVRYYFAIQQPEVCLRAKGDRRDVIDEGDNFFNADERAVSESRFADVRNWLGFPDYNSHSYSFAGLPALICLDWHQSFENESYHSEETTTVRIETILPNASRAWIQVQKCMTDVSERARREEFLPNPPSVKELKNRLIQENHMPWTVRYQLPHKNHENQYLSDTIIRQQVNHL
jgi:hypothetical protein